VSDDSVQRRHAVELRLPGVVTGQLQVALVDQWRPEATSGSPEHEGR
jgi:hypothetical protein